jgi:hypothetical protein
MSNNKRLVQVLTIHMLKGSLLAKEVCLSPSAIKPAIETCSESVQSCLLLQKVSSANIIANIRHASLCEYTVRSMRKNWHWVLTVETLDARNSKAALMAPKTGRGGVCMWRDSGVKWVCVGVFGRPLDSVAGKMFSRLIYFVKTVYWPYSAFNAIYKNNAAVSCVTVQDRNVS